MDRSIPFLNSLAEAIPKGVTLGLCIVSTVATECKALFAPSPSQPEEHTVCESHFLSVFLPPAESAHARVLVFAIEVLVFKAPLLTTIFVSKADSTGFLHLLHQPSGSPSIIRSIATAFLAHVVRHQSDGHRIVLSLFARAQSQYLFPGSAENPGKHVLDDRQLIKWWSRALDPIVRTYNHHSQSPEAPSALAYLIVPGCDKVETRAFYPPSSRKDSPEDRRWRNEYPLHSFVTDSTNTTKPPRCLIPRLPDDPKSRYLDDLDGEWPGDQALDDAGGVWKSVKSVDGFWDMMAYRQECSAGRLVGFIWVVIDHLPTIDGPQNRLPSNNMSDQTRRSNSEASKACQPTSENSQIGLDGAPYIQGVLNNDSNQKEDLDSMRPLEPSSGINESPPKTKVEPIEPDARLGEGPTPTTNPGAVKEPSTSPSLSQDQYDSLLDHLLQLDFANLSIATQSTTQWADKISQLSQQKPEDCIVAVSGLAEITANPLGQNNSNNATFPESRPVNLLMGVRKKRKVEESTADSPVQEPAVNTLRAGLVRKKPKKKD